MGEDGTRFLTSLRATERVARSKAPLAFMSERTWRVRSTAPSFEEVQ
ncbi:MAG: hypothetical protein AVDCRST_MAG05-172, partial [uncultured Rubrobacteraceae bacterium]